MKVISLLFLTFFMGTKCDGNQNQDIENAVLEYVANTRGFYQKIEIKNHMVSVSKDRDGNDKPAAVKISDSDWKELLGAFQNVKLEELADLKSPTQKRFHDGAAAATLKVTYKDKTYESAAFDHGKPPAEIEKLVNKINSFAKK